jgi:hypothetical protein
LRGAIAISAAVHLAVIAVAWAGVPALFKRDLPEEAPIIVELVTIAEETRAAPEVVKPRPEPPKKEEPPPPPRPEPAAAAEPPPPPPPPPAPKPPAPKPEQVAALPPPPKPEPKPAEAPPPPPETRAAPEPPPKPEPRPKQVDVRPKTKPEPPSKAPKFDAGKIALLIDKSRKDTPEEEAKEEPKSFLQPPPRDQAPVRRAELGNRLTISEIDAIRYQIEQCWSVPAGARDAHDLVIRIHISLRPDGSLKGPPEILDREKMGDSFFRAAAESATRAVQRCTPLKNLPTTKYERWQEITLTFNPRELLGG